jgi:hypothetical protein
MCIGSEAGSYLRLMDFVYHSTLGLRLIKEKKNKKPFNLRPKSYTLKCPIEDHPACGEHALVGWILEFQHDPKGRRTFLIFCTEKRGVRLQECLVYKKSHQIQPVFS